MIIPSAKGSPIERTFLTEIGRPGLAIRDFPRSKRQIVLFRFYFRIYLPSSRASSLFCPCLVSCFPGFCLRLRASIFHKVYRSSTYPRRNCETEISSIRSAIFHRQGWWDSWYVLRCLPFITSRRAKLSTFSSYEYLSFSLSYDSY